MKRRELSSASNPLLVQLRRLAQTPTAYRRQRRVWVEGEHLCRAALDRGVEVPVAVVTEAALATAAVAGLVAGAAELVVVPEPEFRRLSGLESPAAIGFVLELPAAVAPDATLPSIVLDGVQDAGNVGSLLRSASAMGVRQVLALVGTAGLWSPKVLRAGMGAHFNLRLCEGLTPAALDALPMPLLATSSHAELGLHEAPLPADGAWVFGHEGQGVSAELARRCRLSVRIAQPGGEESLNVAAAGAICLYESLRRRLAPL